MRKIVFLALFGLLILSNVKAQGVMVLNPDDSRCVVRCYSLEGGVMGKYKKVVISVDNGPKYEYEYNYKTQTGYNGEKCSWEGDVMQLAKEACRKGISLESIGFRRK